MVLCYSIHGLYRIKEAYGVGPKRKACAFSLELQQLFANFRQLRHMATMQRMLNDKNKNNPLHLNIAT